MIILRKIMTLGVKKSTSLVPKGLKPFKPLKRVTRIVKQRNKRPNSQTKSVRRRTCQREYII